MRVIRFFLKIALLPVIAALTVLQWFFIFLFGFSSVVFDMLAGLFLLTAVLSYLKEEKPLGRLLRELRYS